MNYLGGVDGGDIAVALITAGSSGLFGFIGLVWGNRIARRQNRDGRIAEIYIAERDRFAQLFLIAEEIERKSNSTLIEYIQLKNKFTETYLSLHSRSFSPLIKDEYDSAREALRVFTVALQMSKVSGTLEGRFEDIEGERLVTLNDMDRERISIAVRVLKSSMERIDSVYTQLINEAEPLRPTKGLFSGRRWYPGYGFRD